jgi:Flp pilus assembly protein TadB
LQEAKDSLAKLQALERQNKERIEAVVSQLKNLQRLKQEIEKVTDLVEEFSNSWKSTGSPKIADSDLKAAKTKLDHCRSLLKAEKRKRQKLRLRIAYVELAGDTRKITQSLGLQWVAACLIGGGLALVLALLSSILFTSNLIICISLGGLFFVCGFLLSLALLTVPQNINQALERVKSENSDDQFEAAASEYESADNAYDELACSVNFIQACNPP